MYNLIAKGLQKIFLSLARIIKQVMRANDTTKSGDSKNKHRKT
jgi:hypothetical protein